jgi:hypothetical protein
MADIHYCKSWFTAKRRPTVLWDAAQARRAHEARKRYTVVIGDLARPTHIVNVSNDFVGVEFLDERLRVALDYHFEEYEPDKMFLNMATHRHFDGDSDRVIDGTSYIFERSGEVIVRRESFDPHSIEEGQSQVDVAPNFEAYPKFGDYAKLCVSERDKR